MSMEETISNLINETKAYYCLDCGVCTGSCPVARCSPTFSPRLMVEKALMGKAEDFLSDPDVWSCLTCARCTHRCPADINYLEFTRGIRQEALKLNNKGTPAHNGMLQSIMAIQASGMKQNRVAWAKEAGSIADKGEYFYFVGCLPYFNVIFADYHSHTLDIGRNVIKILNKLGIEPVVSNDEKCCGHDMLWNGEVEAFKKLASENIEVIKAAGSKKVIFNCPEGYYVFRDYYTKYFGDLGFEIIHFYDFLAEKLKAGEFGLEKSNSVVTYQDPCRLGRMAGIYDSPRDIINGVATSFAEMERSRDNSVCCGTTGWMNCSTCSREIQGNRLKEAMATGADTLITACPKCNIHFNCAASFIEGVDIEVKDLTELVVDAMNGNKAQ
jgi:heterodisulfide reductase subunit D